MVYSCHVDSALELVDIAATLTDQYPYFLDSATHGPLGQHSLLLRSSGQHLCWQYDGTITGPGSGTQFLERLDDWIAQERRMPEATASLPFCGGWFIYLGYELAAEIEPVITLPPASDGFPRAFASRCPAAIISQSDMPGRLMLVAEDPDMLQQMQHEISNLQSNQPPASVVPIAVEVKS